MPISETVITFSCHKHKLAVDSTAIDRLGAGKKSGQHLSRNELSIGLYQIDGKEYKVIELFGESPVGDSASIVLIRASGGQNTLAIRACEIENLQTESGYQPIPVFDQELSPIFQQAFASSGTVYYSVDIRELEALCPEAINTSQTISDKTDSAQTKLPIRLNKKHWLPYSLSILNAQIRTGQLQLISAHGEAWINFTSGHPTYAAHEIDYGVPALQTIASFEAWTSYHWHDNETEAAHNISEPLEAIIRELKDRKLAYQS